MVSRVKNLAGQKFGRFTVIEFDRVDETQTARWVCICECGTKVIVRGGSLTTGSSRSCGCLQKEVVGAIRTHGNTAGGKSPEYNAWSSMLARCTNPNNPAYKDYGGRGITVCKEWLTFEPFLADMGKRPNSEYSIDRENNDLGYCKENCRWATRAQQLRNTRRNRFVDTPVGTMILSDAAAKYGLSPYVVMGRLRRGWPKEHLFAPSGSIPKIKGLL